MDVSDTS